MVTAGAERWVKGEGRSRAKGQRMAKGHVRGHVCQKGGGGNGGVMGTLVVGSLGVVAEVAGHGIGGKAK